MRRTSGERPGPERKDLGGGGADLVSSAGIRAIAARGWGPGPPSGQREGRRAVEGARPDSRQRGHEPGAAAKAGSAVPGPGGRTDAGRAGRGTCEGKPAAALFLRGNCDLGFGGAGLGRAGAVSAAGRRRNTENERNPP